MLDTADFSRNPQGPEFGEYGICYVRYGKANKGSAPKPRSVLTLWAWVPEILEEWITQFRPLLAPVGSPALWPSERAARVGLQRINSRFAAYRDALGLPGGLDFHSLRRFLFALCACRDSSGERTYGPLPPTQLPPHGCFQPRAGLGS